MKSDIEKYFDSIRHDILLDQLARKIKDQKLLDLIARILANGGQDGCGLPIGNLTSQFFANVYLSGFDHWIKEEHKVRHYIRYMDDFVCFCREKKALNGEYKAVVIADKESRHYQLVSIHWQESRRIHSVPFHFSIEDGKIVIQVNNTDINLDPIFERNGIPKKDVVVAWHSDTLRKMEGYEYADI